MKVYLHKIDLGDFLYCSIVTLTIKSQILCAEKMYGKFNTFEVRLTKIPI